jgi:hypothetical protein
MRISNHLQGRLVAVVGTDGPVGLNGRKPKKQLLSILDYYDVMSRGDWIVMEITNRIF